MCRWRDRDGGPIAVCQKYEAFVQRCSQWLRMVCLHIRSNSAYMQSRTPGQRGKVPLLPFVLPETNREPLGFDPLEKSVSVKNACTYTAAGAGTEMEFALAVTVLDTASCRAQDCSNGVWTRDEEHLLQRAAACSRAHRRLQCDRMLMDHVTCTHYAAASCRSSFEAIRTDYISPAGKTATTTRSVKGTLLAASCWGSGATSKAKQHSGAAA